MSDALEAIVDFDEAVEEYGQTVTLERSSATANKRTGTVSGAVTSTSFKALTSKPVVVESEGTLTYSATELKARPTVEPKIGDIILMAGKRLRVTGVQSFTLQGLTIYYKLLLGPQ
jgi:hypothetical protein